ncbi:MAG: Gfo/Idh/MocA family oxidoreductase [Verrucomicrobiae bacterium]|nr:Gfo/Idh/MocA family oxidoreductase [Verrucomicrobiae bacterium]
MNHGIFQNPGVSISRLLVVGLGSIGKRHLRIARHFFPFADIRILRHLPADSIPEFANGCFSTVDDAILFLPEIAVIANPATLHVPIAQRLAERGVHLLVEKPLSANVDGVDILLETCRARNVVLQVGYNLRFLPSLQRFREMLRANWIGEVLSLRCEVGQCLTSWRPGADYRKSVTARRELGGGVLLELSHELDYLRWIFGEVVWVSSHLSKQSHFDIDVEDTAHLTIGFSPAEGGRQLIGVLSMDLVRQDHCRVCTAIGDKGTLRWNGLTGVVDSFPGDSSSWVGVFRHQHQPDESYLLEWIEFLQSILDKTVPSCSGEDGLEVLRIVSAARESSESGKRVAICAVEAKENGSE